MATMSTNLTAPTVATPLGTEVATLRVHRAERTDVRLTASILSDGAWLGERVVVEDLPAGTVRYLTDLVLPLPPDGRLLSLRKAAYVDLGPVEQLALDHCEVAIAWRSASLAPLFPVFAGRLVVRPTGIGLEGHYAPPGGVVGRAADRMLLNTAARGTAHWFLDHVAAEARVRPGGVL
jgi:hypothetical protein